MPGSQGIDPVGDLHRQGESRPCCGINPVDQLTLLQLVKLADESLWHGSA
jgi:hypothetical protein